MTKEDYKTAIPPWDVPGWEKDFEPLPPSIDEVVRVLAPMINCTRCPHVKSDECINGNDQCISNLLKLTDGKKNKL